MEIFEVLNHEVFIVGEQSGTSFEDFGAHGIFVDYRLQQGNSNVHIAAESASVASVREDFAQAPFGLATFALNASHSSGQGNPNE